MESEIASRKGEVALIGSSLETEQKIKSERETGRERELILHLEQENKRQSANQKELNKVKEEVR